MHILARVTLLLSQKPILKAKLLSIVKCFCISHGFYKSTMMNIQRCCRAEMIKAQTAFSGLVDSDE